MTFSSRLFLALSVAPFLVAQTKYQTDLIAMNPLGFWPLDNNSVINDVSGHGNSGLLPNGGTFSASLTSPVGPLSLVLTGGNQVFSVTGAGTSSFNFGALQAFTTTAWIKTVNQGQTSMVIVAKADPAAVTGWAMLIDNGNLGGPVNGGRLALALFASGTPLLAVETTIPVNDGRWRMVTATSDGSGSASGVHLYVDGNNASTATIINVVGSGSILNTAPLTIGNAADGSGPFEGNLSGVAVFGVALTPAQVLQLATDATASRAILGQFAFGGGWYSAIYFFNGSLNEVSFTVNFIGDDSNPLNVPSLGSSKVVDLLPGASTVLEAQSSGSTVNQGYASVNLPVGVTGYGVFRRSIAGIADQEAVVPLAYANVTTLTMVYDEINSITSVAIINPSTVDTSITVTVEDQNGNVIATSASPLVLQPGVKKEDLLRQLTPGLSAIVNNRGIAKFTVSTGSVAVLGLRSRGLALTSIPTVSQRVLFDFPGQPFF